MPRLSVLRSLRVYILKQLFFSISVNSGRIFTSPLRGSVNILPLFTSISKNKYSAILTFCYSSAIISEFDLIWETSAASATQFKNFPAGSESSIRKMANLARFISLYKK